jgi:hypothetical protein
VFRPDQPVTLAELLQMLFNATGVYKDTVLDWSKRGIQAAVDEGFVSPDVFSNVNSNLLRGEGIFIMNTLFMNVHLTNGKTIYQQFFGVNPPPTPTPPTPTPAPPTPTPAPPTPTPTPPTT